MNASITNTPASTTVRAGAQLFVGLIAALLTLPLVYRGFVTGDAYLYASGIIRIPHQGFGALKSVFNGELSFGYYGLLAFLQRCLGHWIPLSQIMNGLSAVAVIGTTLVLAALFRRLGGGARVGVASALAALLSPAIWFAGLFGNPGAVALGLFGGALLAWDKLLAAGLPVRGALGHGSVSLALYVLALSCRMDLVLGLGAFAGLCAYRRLTGRRALVALLAFMVASVVVAMGWRTIALGQHMPPMSGTVMRHLTHRLGSAGLLSVLSVNAAAWVLGANPLFILLALIAILRWRSNTPLATMVLLWTLPYLVFLPFRGMATSRLMAPAVPAVAFAAMMAVGSLAPRRVGAAVLAALLLSQAAGLLAGAAAGGLASFRKVYRGMPIANHPVTIVPLDRYYRQPYVVARDEVARRVAAIRDVDVLIVGLDELASYEYHLLAGRWPVETGRPACDGVDVHQFITDTNRFIFFDPNPNLDREHPLRQTLACDEIRGARVHVTPFSTAFATDPQVLLLEEEQVEQLLAREALIIGQRTRATR